MLLLLQRWLGERSVLLREWRRRRVAMGVVIHPWRAIATVVVLRRLPRADGWPRAIAVSNTAFRDATAFTGARNGVAVGHATFRHAAGVHAQSCSNLVTNARRVGAVP